MTIINRKKELTDIAAYWENNSNNPAIALIGLPMVGKTTIINQFLAHDPWYADDAHHPVIEMDLSTAVEQSGYEMVRSQMILASYNLLSKRCPECVTPEITDTVEIIRSLGSLMGITSYDITQFNLKTVEYFKQLNDVGVMPTFVVSRFEKAWKVIATELFSIFRLIIQARHMRMLISSTRPIESIVAEADKVNVGEISSFPSCVKEIFVGMFSRDEARQFTAEAWKVIKGIPSYERLPISTAIEEVTGRFPYLMSEAYTALKSSLAAGKKPTPENLRQMIDAEKLYSGLLKNLDRLIFSKNEQPAANGHSRIVNALHSLATIGWTDDMRDNLPSILVKYGLVAECSEPGKPAYSTFAPAFTAWLNRQITPEARTAVALTEQNLRNICIRFLQEDGYQFGYRPDQWAKYLTDYYVNLDFGNMTFTRILREKFADLSARHKKNRVKYPECNILESAYISDYWIMFIEKNWEEFFINVFIPKGGVTIFEDLNDFDSRYHQMEYYRNENLAHYSETRSHADMTNPETRNQVTATCMAINALVKRYFDEWIAPWDE